MQKKRKREHNSKNLVESDDFKKDWAKWEKMFFPIHKHYHWFLIVADKSKREIFIYDPLAHSNKYQLYLS
jgi:Ulp1 family protease